MNIFTNLVKYRFTHGSKAWFRQHVNDEFVKKATQQNYRSRAAFKLSQIQEKYKILGDKIIDLGAAPGSWSQYALRYKKSINAPKINVVSVDILDMKPIEGVHFYKCDARDRKLHQMFREKYGYFDSIISDMAPNFTGVSFETHEQILGLNKMCVKLALELSHQNCCLVMKTIEGSYSKIFSQLLQLIFEQAHRFKPKASRSESKQFFLVCKKFRKQFYCLDSKSDEKNQQIQGQTNQHQNKNGKKLMNFINDQFEQIIFQNQSKRANKKELKKILENYIRQSK